MENTDIMFVKDALNVVGSTALVGEGADTTCTCSAPPPHVHVTGLSRV